MHMKLFIKMGIKAIIGREYLFYTYMTTNTTPYITSLFLRTYIPRGHCSWVKLSHWFYKETAMTDPLKEKNDLNYVFF